MGPLRAMAGFAHAYRLPFSVSPWPIGRRTAGEGCEVFEGPVTFAPWTPRRPALAPDRHRRALGPGPRLPLLRRLRRAPVPPRRRHRHAGGDPERRRRLRADAAVLPARPALQRDRRGRARSPGRSSPASSSAGCPASCGSASASSSSARCTTSRAWSPRCATAPARSPRSSARARARGPGCAMMAFIWIALVYVIVAFTDITAATFVGQDRGPAGPGASPSTPAARSPLAAIAVPRPRDRHGRRRALPEAAALALDGRLRARRRSAWCGSARSCSTLLDPRRREPGASLILAYCFVASLMPVWALLQPRGYLGGFVLYIGARGRRRRHLLRRLPDRSSRRSSAGTRPGPTGGALPVPVRDHRLRRVLGLPRPGLLGHDLEADRARSRTAGRSATARCCSRRSSR